MLKRLWECLTVWRVAPTSLCGAQAILVHAAGENSPNDPGLVNEFLSDIVRRLHRQLKIPVIIQGEIKPCLSDVPLFAVSPRQGESGKYLTSWDIALWQMRECEKIGAKTVVVVSYYPHYWRAVKTSEKVGFTVLTPVGLREIYDPNNSQKWARSKWVNRLYEFFLARPYSFLRGWI